MKKILFAAVAALFVSGCTDADIASTNLSKAADNFEINRRVVFYNSWTGDFMLEVIGRCSIGNDNTADDMSITCKTGHNEFKKHFLGRSANVTYFAEQLEGLDVSTYHYRVTFKPQAIIPDVDLQVDLKELTTDRN